MDNFDTDKIIKYAGESKQQVIDSRDVARMIGKTHRHLMRDIRGYINDMKDSPKLDSPKFFIESSYISSQNKELPCYLLTKQGCEFVANKLTGRKGTIFTATKGLIMNKKIFIQILKTILFSVIGGALGSLITFYFMSR